MTVEIFSVTSADGSVARSTGNSIQLDGTSDVYFGGGAAGIAFYEKAGRDLTVTLLDGQEVLVRNFFVVDENGGVSRLLLGPDGEVEITGMLAPEPFMPLEEREEVDQAAPDTEAPPVEAAAGVGEAMGTEAPTAPASDGGSEAAGGLFGLNMEQIGIGLATAGVAAASAGGFGGGDEAPATATAGEPAAPVVEPAAPEELPADTDEDGDTGLFAFINRLLGGEEAPEGEAAMGGGLFDDQAPETQAAGRFSLEPSGPDALADLFDADASAEG